MDELIMKLPGYRTQLEELDKSLSTPEVMGDMKKYKEKMMERSHLAPIVEKLEEMEKLSGELADSEEMLKSESDGEMMEIIKDEIEELKAKLQEAEKECKVLLVPPDPLEGKNIIMEIRAGTGGEEAALFAADIFRMYTHYAEKKRWKIEIMSQNETERGGYKEIVCSISGKDVYGSMRYESGVHRVQRVPETESGDVMRAGGPGGQCVNTTDSAVRITHLPTGIVVIQQDEKSQLKNKNKAMRVLRSRLFEMEEAKKQKERADARKSMVGSGDRSERIRTYNFPQNRCTDHRVNLTSYNLDGVINGDLDEFIDALKIKAGEDALKES